MMPGSITQLFLPPYSRTIVLAVRMQACCWFGGFAHLILLLC
jgi:hypothetical protein